MKHLKRQGVPKRWPIPRKGTKYVVSPNFNPERGIPMLIILRDILGVCQRRKEVKRVLYEKKILLNNKIVRNDKNVALLLDTISIIPSKKHYRVTLSKSGKYFLEEIKEDELIYKTTKVIGKKILNGKKIQLNLRGGSNFISDMKCDIGDSAIINFKDKKIEKCLPLKEKARVIIFEGKHAGNIGVIRKLKSERKMASITSEDKEINVLIKQIMVVE
jgi:small subunit ribosomal protein S4e